MIDIARENREQTDATQRVLLAESYFGLRLAQEVVRVRQDTLQQPETSLRKCLETGSRRNDRQGRMPLCASEHGRSATLAGSLAKGNSRSAKRFAYVAQHNGYLQHTARFPAFHKRRATCKRGVPANHANRKLYRQPIAVAIAYTKQQLRIEQSGYLPDIAVFGKQTLYATASKATSSPAPMIGRRIHLNLLTVLAREKRIRQSKIAQQTLSIGQEKAKDDLSVGIDKLYTQMQKAQDKCSCPEHNHRTE